MDSYFIYTVLICWHICSCLCAPLSPESIEMESKGEFRLFEGVASAKNSPVHRKRELSEHYLHPQQQSYRPPPPSYASPDGDQIYYVQNEGGADKQKQLPYQYSAPYAQPQPQQPIYIISVPVPTPYENYYPSPRSYYNKYPRQPYYSDVFENPSAYYSFTLINATHTT